MSILDEIARGGRTSALDIVQAKTQGKLDASKLADSALSRKVKEAEYDDYLEGREARRMKRDEFTSPEAQQARTTKQEAGMSTDERNIANTQKQAFWDQANFLLDESTTQEDYNKVFTELDPGLIELTKATGDWSRDKEKIRRVLDGIKDSVSHVQALEKIRATSSSKGGVKKQHKPGVPVMLKDPSVARMIIGADPDLNNLIVGSDAANTDALAARTMTRANSRLGDSYQTATMLSGVGKPWNMLTTQEAIAAALETEKALMVMDTEGSEIEFLSVEEAVQQKNDWISTNGERIKTESPNMRGLIPTMFIKRMEGIYESYMVSMYQTKRFNLKEAAIRGR